MIIIICCCCCCQHMIKLHCLSCTFSSIRQIAYESGKFYSDLIWCNLKIANLLNHRVNESISMWMCSKAPIPYANKKNQMILAWKKHVINADRFRVKEPSFFFLSIEIKPELLAACIDIFFSRTIVDWMCRRTSHFIPEDRMEMNWIES